ncbi:unnamed protein product [Caenorhabditis brenneri]
MLYQTRRSMKLRMSSRWILIHIGHQQRYIRRMGYTIEIKGFESSQLPSYKILLKPFRSCLLVTVRSSLTCNHLQIDSNISALRFELC